MGLSAGPGSKCDTNGATEAASSVKIWVWHATLRVGITQRIPRRSEIDLEALVQRVSCLQDDELWTLVHVDSAHYRPEALVYAKAEMNRRGVSSRPSRPPQPARRLVSILGFCSALVSVARRNAFRLGFLVSLVLFLWTNHNSYTHRYYGNCDDCFADWGYPFPMYETGGFAGLTTVLWPGFIANTVIAACAGVCLGLALSLVLWLAEPKPRASA